VKKKKTAKKTKSKNVSNNMLRAQLDEARREICEWVSLVSDVEGGPRVIAESRGWDCYTFKDLHD
jgi:hypothetical protein